MSMERMRTQIRTQASKDELLTALFRLTIDNEHFCDADAREWSRFDAERLESAARMIHRELDCLEGKTAKD